MRVDDSDLERRFERLLRDELTRRSLVRRGAAGAFGASIVAQLAACGDELSKTRSPNDAPRVGKGEISRSMLFSNWPLYIDRKRETLASFERRYGTHTRYVEEINDNQQFFGKVQQQYAEGDSGGRDLHVVSDWMAGRMIRLGYVEKLDRSALPTVERNLIDRLRKPLYDPKRDFSVPWQSGMTGIVYRKDKVKREPRTVNDLFDPAYRGKVTLLRELYDTVPMVLLGMGADPKTASVDELMKAIDKVEEASRSGQVRRFTGNEYTRDLGKGDSWLVLGWSGDAIQLQADNPDIAFVRPEEGFLLWSDNMQIPIGAPHAYTAEKFMDFVYRPEIQKPITEWVNYVCPVKGVRELVERDDPELASDPLIFPTEETLVGATDLRPLKRDEERDVESAYQQAIGA